MSEPKFAAVSAADLIALTNVARIRFKDGRSEAVAPAFDGVLQLFDALDAVDVGETPPANAFDARWRNG
jgi:Asp-tRNA(Asn)/Glu-tRNA(Gln) amidotransferase C subunit